MREEENRCLAMRWFEEVWNARREAMIDEVMKPDSIGHMEGMKVIGPVEFKTARAALLTAFPDLRVFVEGTVAEGDVVVVRWKATGTHRGLGFGVQATGTAVEFRGMTWFVIVDGRFIEGWDAWNQGALVESLRAAVTIT
jgi:predicted ester cyclase